MPRLTVAIVSWNTREQLARCLRSIEPEIAEEGVRVVVADNASTDGSAEMVRRDFGWVRLLAREHNGGFADGVNAAIRAEPGDFVLVLNPDIELEPGQIPALLDFLEAHPRTAAVAPLLVGKDGEPQANLYRRFPTLAQVLLFWTAAGFLLKRSDRLRQRYFEHDLSGAEPVSVDQIPGAAMMIRGEALSDVGEMDPGYFIWFEDVDWCYRARRAGWSLYALPEVRMRHEGGASFRTWGTEKRFFQFYRAFFRFLCKFRRDRLIAVASPVLRADLRLSALLIPLHRLRHPEVGEERVRLPLVRRAIRDVVRRYRRGELVAFGGADPDSPVRSEPLPPLPDGTVDGSPPDRGAPLLGAASTAERRERR